MEGLFRSSWSKKYCKNAYQMVSSFTKLKLSRLFIRSLNLCWFTVQAAMVLVVTGFSRCLVQYDKPYNPGYWVAYGILAEFEEHPFDVDKMVFMDQRDSNLNKEELKERNCRIPTFLYAIPFSSHRILSFLGNFPSCSSWSAFGRYQGKNGG